MADLSVGQTSVADPCSRVAEGPAAGRSLGELLAEDAEVLVGSVPAPDGRFPLLVKTLDARQHLSVQVHPSAEYARRHPPAASKTESWLILDADPGAVLYLGVRHGVSFADVRAAAGTPELVGLLREVPARPGSLHHLPAGLLHALGAGVLAMEVQTPSDTTYRLYDWSQEYGRTPRELHLEAALDVASGTWPLNVDHQRSVHRGAGETGELLATDAYRMSRVTLSAGAVWRSAPGAARVAYVEEGRVRVDGSARALRRGGCVLLPAGWEGEMVAEVPTRVIEVVVVGPG